MVKEDGVSKLRLLCLLRSASRCWFTPVIFILLAETISRQPRLMIKPDYIFPGPNAATKYAKLPRTGFPSFGL